MRPLDVLYHIDYLDTDGHPKSITIDGVATRESRDSRIEYLRKYYKFKSLVKLTMSDNTDFADACRKEYGNPNNYWTGD